MNNFSPEELETLKDILDNGLPRVPCNSCGDWWTCREADKDTCTIRIKHQSKIHEYANSPHWEYYDVADTIYRLNKRITEFEADRDGLLSVLPLKEMQNDE